MDTVPKPKGPRSRGQRSWTDAQRAEQAAKLHTRKIWLNSTGPRSPLGKQTSSRNSYKHGRFSYEKTLLRWYVRLAEMRIRKIRTLLNLKNHKRENELRDKYGFAKPPQPDIMAFYPYFKVHPLSHEALYPPKKPREPTERQKQKEIYDFLTSHDNED